MLLRRLAAEVGERPSTPFLPLLERRGDVELGAECLQPTVSRVEQLPPRVDPESVSFAVHSKAGVCRLRSMNRSSVAPNCIV